MEWRDITSYPEDSAQPRVFETTLGEYRFGITKAPEYGNSWAGYAYGPMIATRRVNLRTHDMEDAKTAWLCYIAANFQELVKALKAELGLNE